MAGIEVCVLICLMKFVPLRVPFVPLQTYTADPMLEWVDVREWVVETYPWPNAINVNKLRTLSPEDVGWNHGKIRAVADMLVISLF